MLPGFLPQKNSITIDISRININKEKNMADFNDIGISRELDLPRIKKLLSIGLFASALHFAGDMILG